MKRQRGIGGMQLPVLKAVKGMAHPDEAAKYQALFADTMGAGG